MRRSVDRSGDGISRLEHQPRSKPLDFNTEAIGIVVESKVGFVSRAVPVDDAAVARDIQYRIGKEVLEGAPEHHVVNADDS